MITHQKAQLKYLLKIWALFLAAGKRADFTLPVSAAAFKQFAAAKAMGLEDEDNAAMIKVYSRLNDIKLPDIKKK